MKTKLIILICLLIGTFTSQKLPANNWHSYLSYYQIIAIAKGNQKIFAASENGIFSYNHADNSLVTRSRVEGLSDSGISTIAWSDTKEALLIGYSNGNLDMLAGGTIFNLPDLKQKTSVTNKSINNIYCEGDFAWLCCDFGILKINLKRWEVAETWIIGPEASPIPVKDLVADGQYFWVATGSGIFRAEKSNLNLQDFHNWILQDNLPFLKNKFNSITLFNNGVYACDNEGKVYCFDGTYWKNVYPEINGIRKIKAFQSALAIVCQRSVEIISSNNRITVLSYGAISPAASVISPSDVFIGDSGELWIGDISSGLIRKTADGLFSSIGPSSPENNNVYRLTASGSILYVATGQDNPEYGTNPAEIHILKDKSWVSINGRSDNILSGLKDITRIAPSPADLNRYWGSTRENGLIDFEGQRALKNYNSTNSPLESFNGSCKTGGLAYDSDGNLWITNPLVKNQLHVIKADGSWKSFSYPGIDNQFVSAGDLIITKAGTKWIIVNNSDLFALRTGNSLENVTDDQYIKTSVRSRFSNSETTVLKGFNQINAISEDHDGYLWVGTENGIVLYTNPESIFSNNGFYGIQPSVDLGDGLFHPLLENITVSTIAIDGGNRKWFGTTNSGVFLFSEDGSKLIHHFNTDNSPLFSNKVNSISINGRSGEVFFATETGLISWMGGATEERSSFQDLYVWPNPVRETYTGDITIDGLSGQSAVKIADIAGNLVFQTTSTGGRAVWNGKNRDGDRVSTGVYLIFCSDKDSKQSRVIKLLFLH
jgi:ligand-binding sensor domain-containing protein